jgi:hypothetical protein
MISTSLLPAWSSDRPDFNTNLIVNSLSIQYTQAYSILYAACRMPHALCRIHYAAKLLTKINE